MTVELDLPNPTYVGTTGTATLTFANPDAPDTPVDPSAVAVQYLQGATWTSFSYPDTITKLSVGKYTLEFPITSAGQGIVKGIGTGACAVVEVAYFQAIAPPSPPGG